MNCTICKEPIILSPSATHRAKVGGGKASDYEKIFTTHSECLIEKRKNDMSEFLRKREASRDIRIDSFGRMTL